MPTATMAIQFKQRLGAQSLSIHSGTITCYFIYFSWYQITWQKTPSKVATKPTRLAEKTHLDNKKSEV